jgi:hypothetical protein
MESSQTAKGRVRRPFARLVAIGVAAAMAVALLPGVTAAVVYPNVVITPSATTVVAGHTLTFSALEWTSATTAIDVTAPPTVWTTTDPYTPAVPCTYALVGGITPTETCSFFTAGNVIVNANAGLALLGSVVIAVTPAPTDHFVVTMSAFPPAVAPFAEIIGVADTAKVTAKDAFGNTVTNYAGTVRISTNDPLALLPADAALTLGVGTFSITFGSVSGSTPFTVTATDVSHPLIFGTTTVTVSFVDNGSLYTPLTPVRLLDTRSGNGLTGNLVANTPRTFIVAGRGSVPVGAVAVTGNLTVTGSTAGWAAYIGPAPLAAPASSSINFTKGQVRANSITVPLSATGTLSVTYMSTAGNTTDMVFDVTGYYAVARVNTDNTYASGNGYVPADPATRVLDTRNNTGWAGKLSAGLPATFLVGADNPCEGSSHLRAVTGNLTVTNATSGWALFLGPVAQALPTSSTINFTGGQIVANGVTVGVGPSNSLSATYISTPGNTLDLVFDVTGYYCNNGGAAYEPVAPTRLLDTRVGNGYSFPLSANHPQSFQVAGRGGVYIGAVAVTGNVTVVNETNGWAVYVGAEPAAIPPTSNLNFLTGDIIANGMTSALHSYYPIVAGEFGQLNATYISTAGNTTDLVFDVSGYFFYTTSSMG